MSIDRKLRFIQQPGNEIRSILGNNKLRDTISQQTGSTFGLNKLSYSNSLKSLQNDSVRYSQLQYENKILKTQIANLKKQIKYSKENKSQQIIHFQQQVIKLKNIIEKGYFTIKSLQKQQQALKNENYLIKDKYLKSCQRTSYLEQKLGQLINYLQNMKSNHDKQVKLIWERVSHLQKNLQSVVQLIEQDRNQDKIYQNALHRSRYQASSAKSLKYY